MHQLEISTTFGYINKLMAHINYLQLFSLIIRTINQPLGDP